MYKSVRLTKGHSLAIETFNKKRKTVSIVYHTGIRNWVSDCTLFYSIVIGTFRLIYHIDRPQRGCNNFNHL